MKNEGFKNIGFRKLIWFEDAEVWVYVAFGELPGQVENNDSFWWLPTSQGNYKHFFTKLILAGELQ